MALKLDSKRLLFVHIPKTGGMSIRHALMSLWGTEIEEVGTTHNTAADTKALLGIDYDNYFSFSVVRNPYDWAVSLYHFTKTSPEHPDHEEVKDMDFDRYILWLCKAIKYGRTISTGKYLLQSDYLGDNLLASVLRFENLESQFQWLCAVYLKTEIPNMRRINESKDRKHYKEYFKDIIIKQHFDRVFQSDFTLLKYPFTL